MPAFPRLHSAAQRLGCLFMASTALSLSLTAGAQVGPQPPQPRPMQETMVTKAITKLINKSKKTNKDDVHSDAAQQQPTDAADSNTSSAGAGNAPNGNKLQVGMPNMMEAESAIQNTKSPLKHPPLINQPPLTNAHVDEPEIDSQNPPILTHPKLDDPTNPLGFTESVNKLKKYSGLVDAQRFTEAKPGLMQLRQSLVDLTEAHIGLYKTLNQLPSARGQAELEKELALQFAQLRDHSMMEMARVYIGEKEFLKAVKELTEVVKSQPKSKIGLRSYEMLQEIGFTEKLQLTQ